jgi:hypothetical protein
MPPSDLRQAFSDLMLRGINLTRAAQEGDAIYAGVDRLHDAFRDYQIWRSDIRDFLADAKVNTLDWYKLYESDSVPLLKGGIEYSDIKSEKSQTLLRNIRVETSSKLDILHELGRTLFQDELPKTEIENPDVVTISGAKNFFSFNVATGNVRLNSSVVNLPPGQQKYLFLKALVQNKERHAAYDEICSVLKIKSGKVANRKIQGLLKEIKEALHILGENGESNPDIFVNVPRVGYRIVIE